jgi:hypothetical protein
MDSKPLRIPPDTRKFGVETASFTNAKEAAKAYWKEIKRMQPFWNSDGDNLQFWVFSRLAGVLRYQVYRGGIWNEATRSRPVLPEPALVPFPRPLRTAA